MFSAQVSRKNGRDMSNELAKQISYILYSSPEEDVKVTALVKDETIWLTQKAMAELFDVRKIISACI